MDEPASLEAAPQARHRSALPRSGWVTAVAVISLVLGALEIVYGALLLWFVSALSYSRYMSPLEAVVYEFKALFGAFAVIALLLGCALIVAGLGTVRRKPWGRILALVLAGLAALVALGSVVPFNPVSLALHAAYAVLVFVVLLNPRFAAEFDPAGLAGRRFLGPPWTARSLSTQGNLPVVGVASLAPDGDDVARRLTGALAPSPALRVIAPALLLDLLSVGTTNQRSVALWLGALGRFGVDVIVLVAQDGDRIRSELIEVRTGILLRELVGRDVEEVARQLQIIALYA
jgi:hypothetical protein